MRTIGVDEARRRFGTLLAEVERGEAFLITRYGVLVAFIEPMRNAPNDAAAIEDRHRYRQDRAMTSGDEVAGKELEESRG